LINSLERKNRYKDTP